MTSSILKLEAHLLAVDSCQPYLTIAHQLRYKKMKTQKKYESRTNRQYKNQGKLNFLILVLRFQLANEGIRSYSWIFFLGDANK